MPTPERENRPGSGTQTLERPRPDETDSGDRDRFSHYVAKDKIVESAVTGSPVTALCGKKWIPSRDPKKYPVCPTCKELYDSGVREPVDPFAGFEG